MTCFYKNAVNIFVHASTKPSCGTFATAPSFITVIDDEIVNRGSKLFWEATNNFGELYSVYLGVREALNYADSDRFLNVYSDDFLVTETMNSWVFNWFKKSQIHRMRFNAHYEFRNSDGDAVKYQELMMAIIRDICQHNTHVSLWRLKGSTHSSVLEEMKKFKEVFLKNVYSSPEDLDMPMEIFMEMADYNQVVDKYSREKLYDFINNTSIEEKKQNLAPKVFPMKFYPDREIMMLYRFLIKGKSGSI